MFRNNHQPIWPLPATAIFSIRDGWSKSGTAMPLKKGSDRKINRARYCKWIGGITLLQLEGVKELQRKVESKNFHSLTCYQWW